MAVHLGRARSRLRQLQRWPQKAAKPTKAKGRKARSGGVADRDLATVLAYVRANPGKRSEEIQKGIGGDGALIKEALAALTAKGQLQRKGYGRGGSYTA